MDVILSTKVGITITNAISSIKNIDTAMRFFIFNVLQ